MAQVHAAGSRPSIDSRHGATLPYQAVLFDMDGVVTQTAAVHAAAWKQLFDSVLQDPRLPGRPGRDPFDEDADYRRYVDGRQREDGVTAFLASRGAQVPAGSPEDGPDVWSVHGLGARKNALFLEAVMRNGIQAYPGTTALLTRLRAAGIPVCLVTASRNARALLTAAGLDTGFDVIIDGQTAAEHSLPGKPDPAMFLEAARRLGVAPRHAAVVEDAAAGVQAGRRGGFGLVVGIDRAGHREQLELAGADIVLGDVAELDLGVSRTDPWMLVYAGFDPAHEGHREALTALGNGYMAMREPSRSTVTTASIIPAPIWPGSTTGRRAPFTAASWKKSIWSTSPTGWRWMCASAPARGGQRGISLSPRSEANLICAGAC